MVISFTRKPIRGEPTTGRGRGQAGGRSDLLAALAARASPFPPSGRHGSSPGGAPATPSPASLNCSSGPAVPSSLGTSRACREGTHPISPWISQETPHQDLEAAGS